jgi:hypothetical protein
MIIMGAAADTAAKLKWYEGGTLHKLSALDWQKATYANKLATCADFVAHAWVNKKLKNSIAKKIHAKTGRCSPSRMSTRWPQWVCCC